MAWSVRKAETSQALSENVCEVNDLDGMIGLVSKPARYS